MVVVTNNGNNPPPAPKRKPTTQADLLDSLPKLSKKQKNALLQGETGTAFDLYTRMFASFRDGDVFETGEWRARDLDQMFRRDGDAVMIESALTLPLRSATYNFTPAKGDTGELELVQEQLFTPPEAGGIDPDLQTIIGQMSGASYYRKAFFEKEYDWPGGDTVYLRKLSWRPPATCEIKRNERTAQFDGFRQRAWWFASTPKEIASSKNWTGYIDIPKVRAFVFIHGVHRQPLTGTSDMDVIYWAYKQKQKILFLWFQFLEQQSLPKIAAYGPDPDSANQIAEAIASMKASGVAGFQRPPQGGKLFDIIASSGAGAQQFQSALQFLQSYQSRSVLAGFLELGNAAALGRGSYALAESQSDFFLQHREAVKKEMCSQFTRDVTAPLCILNKWGSDAKIPRLTAAPLSQTDSAQIISVLTAGMAAPQMNIPFEFLDLVAEKVGTIFDLPTDKVQAVLQNAAAFRAKQEALKSAQGAGPVGQGAAKIAGTAQAASKIASMAGAGERPLPK
jgi:hypothetical protein